MAQSRKVRISNSTLNSYGTRVLTEGVDLTQYKKNPILLWMHTRAWTGRKDDILPLGVINNIQIEGDDITGELMFDNKDEFAKSIAQKWDDGILKMVSPNFDIIAVDESQELTLPGQTRATITKSKLIEVSVVDIGGNDDNIVLSKDGKELKLSEGGEGINLPLLNTNNKNDEKNMKAIALKLGLQETATEAEILAKVGILLGFQKTNENLTKERDDLKLSLDTMKREKDQLLLSAITDCVQGAIASRKILAEKKDHFIELGKKTGIESLKLTFDSMSSVTKPGEIIGGKGSSSVQLGAQDWKKLSDVPADKMAELRENDKPTYMKLYKAEYGVDCHI